MAELNPAVGVNVVSTNQTTQSLEWSNLGSYYAYTVEYCDNLTNGQWQSVPGVTWPIRQTSWTMPVDPYSSQIRFFRVRAELVGP